MTLSPTIVVTGANGLVGAEVCRELLERGAVVRGIVRREGTAPDGVQEWVGDFADAGFAGEAVGGAGAVVSTAHPLGSDLETQRTVGVEGTTELARVASGLGVARFVHVSTCAVYDRSPGAGDIDETSALVGDDAGDYAVTKREADQALEGVDAITTVLVRPPRIFGAGESSVWNTLVPRELRDDAGAREVNPEMSVPWVHKSDLAALIADVALGVFAESDDVARGPVAGGCTPVNAVSPERATGRDYYGTVIDTLGVEPTWQDGETWTGRISADRALGWGWSPKVGLREALAEISDGLR